MSNREQDDVTGVETTGHEWDGIKELDNPLPRWWLWVWYGTIAISVVMWILLPAWPGLKGYTQGVLGQSDRADVAQQLEALKVQRGVQGAKLQHATLQQIEADPALQAYALAVGQSVFGDNCATCHGTGGTGSKGYANLRDDVWLWGGSLDEIHGTIRTGVRSGQEGAPELMMPAFGRDQMLTPQQVDDVTEFVMAISRRKADRAAVMRGGEIYQAQCAACHGPTGKGDGQKGAPDLTDGEWLYGGRREEIHAQIWDGKNGVMPAWKDRFDPETVKALAVYIHANAGGQ